MKLSDAVFVAALGICIAPAFGRNVAGKQETRSYSYGVGRITWTFPDGLAADFAVPQWSAGARVLCNGEHVRCEVQVHARDVSKPDEELRDELVQTMRLRFPKLGKQAVNIRTQGANAGVVNVTVEDPRREERLRYVTLGYAYKGPALLRFEVTAGNVADAGAVLALVDAARAIDALEMWALRLREFRTVCGERFPAYKEANDRAFAGSPFAAVEFVREPVNMGETSTAAGIARQRLIEFAAAFDGNPPERRRSFCEGFPRWVAEAAKGL